MTPALHIPINTVPSGTTRVESVACSKCKSVGGGLIDADGKCELCRVTVADRRSSWWSRLGRFLTQRRGDVAGKFATDEHR